MDIQTCEFIGYLAGLLTIVKILDASTYNYVHTCGVFVTILTMIYLSFNASLIVNSYGSNDVPLNGLEGVKRMLLKWGLHKG